VPIRNVIRHLAEVADEAPATLGTVFAERAGTLQSGIGYLENLATNYARLTPRVQGQPCDVDALLRSMLDDGTGGADHERVTLDVRRPLPRAHADPVALRRVIENVMINAIESLDSGRGTVTIGARASGSPDDPRIVVEIADTGSGIEQDRLERIFDDFYTTKDRGTGLGLSIVRRLIADMGGRVQVRSEVGIGTTFTLDLPAERQDGAQRT
jgi:signal transduction histidine kinase